MTVKELRQAKNKVRVIHYRYLEVNDDENKARLDLFPRFELKEKHTLKDVSPRGGKTVIQVSYTNGKEYSAEAVCSLKDNFCYRRGVIIALGRIISQIKA
jgi:hypothetical protein